MADQDKEFKEYEEKKKINKENLRKLTGIFRYVKPYLRYLIIGLIFLIISSVMLMAFPFLIGKLIDAATGPSDWILHSIHSIALVLIAILLIQGIFSYFRVYLFANTSERTVADIRKDLFRKFMFLPVSFYDFRRSGELVSRITADVALLHDSMSVTLAEFIRQVATLLIGTVIIFVMVPKLTIFMIAVFPVVVILALVFGRYIRKLSKQTQDNLASTNIVVTETLQAIREVKAFTNEMREIRRYGRSMSEVVRIALSTAMYRGAFVSFIIFALFGTIVTIIWYGANLLSRGVISVGDLFSFVLYTTFIGGSIAGLGDIYSQLQRTIGASERILEIIDENEENVTAHARKISSLKGDIKFEKVQFTYPTRIDQEVLKGIDLHIHEGEKVALVGPSGAGKSTIIQLLLRFYEPSAGIISVNNVNIRDFNLYHFREKIALVPQEVILFGGSIRENILYGKPDAMEDQILEAASQANALTFINEFPERMNTIVGDRGVALSGGQRQRIAIARAILRDPDLLILDEATSSLDSNSEFLVKEALDKLMKNRTTIIIAHRLATIQKVDRIYVLQHGRIVEAGKHQELLQDMNGVYTNLVKMQISLS